MKLVLPAELQELAVRNEKRLVAAKQQLGTKWLLHPSNRVARRSVKKDLV